MKLEESLGDEKDRKAGEQFSRTNQESLQQILTNIYGYRRIMEKFKQIFLEISESVVSRTSRKVGVRREQQWLWNNGVKKEKKS